nr:peptidoglycan editing factor PgeF [Aquabacterium sp.]
MAIDFGAGLAQRLGAIMSARAGGISQASYAQCNLGDHVQDDPQAVAHNREVFAAQLQARPAWLTQVHGNRMIRLTNGASGGDLFNPVDVQGSDGQPEADGALTTEPGLACTVMVADCLPLLLAAPEGRGVAALHAGWRGLAGAGAGAMAGRGIVHTGVAALCEAASCDPAELRVWLGPCIGPQHFEVGADVLIGFGVDPREALPHPRFTPSDPALYSKGGEAAADDQRGAQPKWLADLPGLARDILQSCGVEHISGGTWCTVSDASRFFSFRRDRVTGRQAAGICLRG